MKLKSLAIMLIILVSLIPVYFIYKYLEKLTRPRESLQRFFAYMLSVLLLVFMYTYLLVLAIKLVFPKA